MTFPLARLVSAPDPSATVRYDFNDKEANAGRRVQAEGFTLGAPILLSAPDSVAPLYGDRGLSFRHQIMGDRSDALAALAVLSRELLRPTNWFMFQLGGLDTRPTFWRLRATGPEALSFDRWYVDTESGDPELTRLSSNAFEIGVSLTAEAFGYGERITLGPYTVAQDATGTNPMRVELPTIKGDARTALRVKVSTDEDDEAGDGSEWLLAAIASPATPDDIVVNIGTGDGWTVVNAPDVSGGIGGTSRLVDGSGGVATLIRILPAVASGRYKALLRYRMTAGSAGENFVFRVTQDSTGSDSTPPFDIDLGTVVLPLYDDPSQGWLDLCQIATPFGNELPTDVATPPQPARICIEVTAPAGEAIYLDAIKLIPVDGPELVTTVLQTRTTIGAPVAFGAHGTWDGDAETCWVTDETDAFVMPSRVTSSGGFPVIDPAASKNTLVVMATSNGSLVGTGDPSITTVGSESEVTVSYHPRLLHLDGRP